MSKEDLTEAIYNELQNEQTEVRSEPIICTDCGTEFEYYEIEEIYSKKIRGAEAEPDRIYYFCDKACYTSWVTALT